MWHKVSSLADLIYTYPFCHLRNCGRIREIIRKPPANCCLLLFLLVEGVSDWFNRTWVAAKPDDSTLVPQYESL